MGHGAQEHPEGLVPRSPLVYQGKMQEEALVVQVKFHQLTSLHHHCKQMFGSPQIQTGPANNEMS